jgi:hypothetical protein
MTNADQTSRDIHQTITDRLVSAIEAGAPTFEMPWHSKAASTLPVNGFTKKAYRGVNILALWVAQLTCGFRTSTWATYRQWQERGAQVRKGEKASLIVFYKEQEREVEVPETGEPKTQKRFIARASFVFNADQVDGYTSPELPVSKTRPRPSSVPRTLCTQREPACSTAADGRITGRKPTSSRCPNAACSSARRPAPRPKATTRHCFTSWGIMPRSGLCRVEPRSPGCAFAGRG